MSFLVWTLVFTACGNEAKQKGSGGSGRITLRILSATGQGDFPDGSDENHNIFVDFLKEKTPYDFDYTFFSTPEARNALIASGMKYDMIRHGTDELKNLLILQQQNFLSPVDEYLPGANYLMNPEQTPAVIWDSLTIEGKKWAVPIAWSELYYGVGMRVDWLEKLGLQPPKTIDDFRNVLIAFRDRDPDGNGIRDTIPLSIDGTSTPIPPNLRSLWGIPQDYLIENGKVQYAYATNAARDMVSWVADLYAQGLLDPEFATSTGEIQGQRLTNDKIGCIIHQPWWDMKFWDIAIKESKGLKHSPYWWIAPPNNAYGKPTKLQICGPIESFMVFPQGGHTKEAVDLLNRMLDPVLAETLTFGFENVHWKRDANGVRYLTEEYNNIIWRWKYCDGIMFHRGMMVESEDLEYGDYRIPIQQYAGGPETWDLITPPIVGIEQQLVDINEYVNLEITKFIMGERPMRDYDRFIAELRSIGLNEVLAAKQKAWEDTQK